MFLRGINDQRHRSSRSSPEERRYFRKIVMRTTPEASLVRSPPADMPTPPRGSRPPPGWGQGVAIRAKTAVILPWCTCKSGTNILIARWAQKNGKYPYVTDVAAESRTVQACGHFWRSEPAGIPRIDSKAPPEVVMSVRGGLIFERLQVIPIYARDHGEAGRPSGRSRRTTRRCPSSDEISPPVRAAVVPFQSRGWLSTRSDYDVIDRTADEQKHVKMKVSPMRARRTTRYPIAFPSWKRSS